MNKNIKISVIIPVYNAEKYLVQCLDSLISQNLDEIEIICVNDGSTDNSIDILKEYSEKDERISIIDQKNQGGAPSRSNGLKTSSGEYILFLDNDDWIEENALTKLYNNAISNNSDLVLFKAIYYDENEDDYIFTESYDFEKYFDKNVNFNNFIFTHESIKFHLLNNTFAAWNKMYKSNFLKSFDFYFENITYADVPFHVQVLLTAKKISFLPEALYFYRTNHSSSMMEKSSKSRDIFDIFTVISDVKKILIKNNLMNEYNYEFSLFQIQQIIFWMNRVDENISKEFFDESKQNLLELNLSDEYNKKIPEHFLKYYENIIKSETFMEMKLRNKIDKIKLDNLKETNDIKYLLKHNKELFNEKILKEEKKFEDLKKKSSQAEKKYIFKLEKQKKLYEDKLFKKNKNLKQQKKIINEMKSSNSWKITKPIRKLNKFFK